MTDDLADALLRLFERLGPYAARDPELRAAVAGLGTALAAWAGSIAPVPEAPPEPPPLPAPAPLPPPPVPVPAPVRVVVPLRAAPFPEPEPEYDEPRHFEPDPLAVIARRCEVKALACRLQAAILAGELDRYDGPTADALHARAGAVGRFDLWPLFPGDYVTAPRAWDDLAGAFDTAAAAAEMLVALAALPEGLAARHRRQALYLAAEAQGLLLAAAADVHRRTDTDQVQLYVHVRERAREANQYIDRYLTRGDRVDPGTWPDVFRRVAAARDAVADLTGKAKAREKAMKNLAFKLTRMAGSPDAAAEWPRVLELLDLVVEAGVPPTDREFRELLLPVWHTYPDELARGPNADRVFRAVDEYRAALQAVHVTEPEAPEEPKPQVREAAELLRGRDVVFIGGIEKPAARKALVAAFGLADLNWISTRPHESITTFEPAIARPEVAVVLLAIKWASHSFGDVVDYCTKYGKPLVRLKSGYNPNQIAHQILTQAGDRLRLAWTG